VQFDTIYHEHYSYLSLFTTKRIFNTHGLEIFDVDEIPTHGGSLRIYAGHAEDKPEISAKTHRLLETEFQAGMADVAYYKNFQAQVDIVKQGLVKFLVEQKNSGKTVAAYGAAAKGNTLFNYCGIKKRPD
ncbi:methyltransferase C-terminal domain-containing protein, partial [Thermodesulfobacteriota bacterium]